MNSGSTIGKCLWVEIETSRPTPTLPAGGEGVAVPPPSTGEVRRGACRKTNAQALIKRGNSIPACTVGILTCPKFAPEICQIW